MSDKKLVNILQQCGYPEYEQYLIDQGFDEWKSIQILSPIIR